MYMYNKKEVRYLFSAHMPALQCSEAVVWATGRHLTHKKFCFKPYSIIVSPKWKAMYYVSYFWRIRGKNCSVLYCICVPQLYTVISTYI